MTPPCLLQVLLDELSSVERWVSLHVSDHSGFHYRQFLLKELMAELSHAPPTASCQAPPPCVPQHRANGCQIRDATEEEEQQGCNSVLKLFRQEMALCSDLIQSYPGHEALWSHR